MYIPIDQALNGYNNNNNIDEMKYDNIMPDEIIIIESVLLLSKEISTLIKTSGKEFSYNSLFIIKLNSIDKN